MSRSSRGTHLPHLPAIAEEPRTAEQLEPSSAGAAATSVAAHDLEAGLRAALEAQRSLQDRRRRREELLRALSTVAHFPSKKLAAKYTMGTPHGCTSLHDSVVLPQISSYRSADLPS